MLALKYKSKKDKKPSKDKKPKKFKGGGLRIVDDDGFGFNSHKVESSDDETVEELPQIAAVVDDRPREMQLLDEWKQGKWKTLNTVKEHSSHKRHDSDDDDDDDQPRSSRRRHDSGSGGDLSPPRRNSRKRHDSDQSPPRRRNRHDSSDESPPRQRKRHDSDDLSPPRARKRHDSGDLSPPRRIKREKSSDDDLSPPRQIKREKSSDDDLSPPRRRLEQSSRGRQSPDFSPPRNSRRHSPQRRRQQNSQSSSKRSIANPEIIEDPNKKGSMTGSTLEGKKAGLQRAADLRKEMVDYRKRESEMFENLDDEISGRNAMTKLRDRATGRERDLAAELEKKQEEERLAAEKKELYDKWGKGLKQVKEQETRVNEALHEISKPLARYSDDTDLDDYLKKQDREGDPMLKFLTKKKSGGRHGSDKPMYHGPQPLPNRFAIPPGYRWDGVDRSNGYEKEWFSKINAKKAIEAEAYKWSVEDL